MTTYALQFAGIILLCITSANFFAPKKMRWSVNLAKTEPVFRQVFIIHCVFLLACVVAMALLCLLKPDWLLADGLGRAVAGFIALFWIARVLAQVFYYEKSIKRQFPFFNILFTVAFLYLATVFTAVFFNLI
ncbi:hypothetical protein NT6N_40000 [Oceaniferula spumae]|uniref:Invasion gene expression up-regulator, SirB n=1 Tax=Oceaniferula spumae TaxID=2979115 RepID=A0AAT9FSQ2_9BACT